MDERLTPERAARILRAKAAELEHLVSSDYDAPVGQQGRLTFLTADIALIAGLLADFMEHVEPMLVLYVAHTENLIERVYELEGGDA